MTNNLPATTPMSKTTKTIIFISVGAVGIFIGYKLFKKFSTDPSADDTKPQRRRGLESMLVDDVNLGSTSISGYSGDYFAGNFGAGSFGGYGTSTSGYGTVSAPANAKIAYTKNGTRLRESSNTNSKIKKTYNKGTELTITGKKTETDGLWLSVKEGSNTGWVREDVVTYTK